MDKKTINWHGIKEGFRGFEKLAVEYVKEQFKTDTWERTSETRDGNKDAVAVVMGYQNGLESKTYWWMEAKYSEAKQRITRYRLDATLVSSILDGNVSKVIFVTNSLINTKTITDIRLVLKKTISCVNVEFCTKYSLEYWLYTHPNIYKMYFDEDYNELDIPRLFVTQEIDCYLQSTECISYKEPLMQIYRNQPYMAYFSLFSPEKTSLKLKPAPHIKGIQILSGANLDVDVGENQLKFCFRIDEDYGDKKSSNSFPVLEFRLGTLHLLTYNSLIPLPFNEQFFTIPIQNTTIEKIHEDYKFFLQKNAQRISVIVGESGVGKTYIIKELLLKLELESSVFLCTFVESQKANSKMIVKLIFYIFLPYVDLDTVDTEFIQKIKNRDICQFLLQLYDAYEDYETLSNLLEQLTAGDLFLAFKIAINHRIIILDNYHNLNSTLATFLSVLFESLYKNRVPCFILLSGQPYFTQKDSYNILKESCEIKTHDISLRLDDIIVCLPGTYIDDLQRINKLTFLPKLSMVDLLIFAHYLLEEGKTITDFNQLILTFRAFQRSEILKNAIINKFRQLFGLYPECKKVCNQIYWSFTPITYAAVSGYEDCLQRLVVAKLIRFDFEENIVPYHDIYKKIYRKIFKPSSQNEIGYIPGTIEYLRSSLENKVQYLQFRNSVNDVKKLFEQKQFHTILYVLDGAFTSSGKESLKNLLSEALYYELYYIYGFSAHQQSTEISCKAIFDEIYRETKKNLNVEILHICRKSAFELCVIAYENLEYDEVNRIGDEIYKLIETIHRRTALTSDIKWSISYHDVAVMKCLVQTDLSSEKFYDVYEKLALDMRNYQFDYRYESYRARYALTLCIKDIDLCLSLLRDGLDEIGNKYGLNDKHHLWCDFYYHFYSLISKNDLSCLEKMIIAHEKMKINQYGNYRKKLYAIAAYFYSIGDVENGDCYLFKDAYFNRKIRNRSRAFYFETLAVREYVNDNIENALQYLREANSIWMNLNTYKKIVIHNKLFLERKSECDKKVRFWFGEPMRSDTYYLDPRSAW